METILDSIRVVEMTEALAGPYCAMLLGDFGADVIKVERPGVGDQSRGWGSAVCGERIHLLSCCESQQAIDYAELQSSERRGSVAKTAFDC